MPEPILLISGREYRGWTSLRVSRSLESLSGSFELGLTAQKASISGSNQFLAGQACVLKLGEHRVITGWIDAVNWQIRAEEETLTLTGRDRTCDLVDCSAPGRQWQSVTLRELAERLCQPYGISVRSTLNLTQKFKSVVAQPGESVAEVLGRCSRARGALLTTDGEGALLITRAGSKRNAQPVLAVPGFVLELTISRSLLERFSEYSVQGQTPGGDFDAGGGLSYTVKDAEIQRFRPLTVLADGVSSKQSLHRRAEWERNNRRGKGKRLEVLVQGWTYNDRLWTLNEYVRIGDSAGLESYLITGCEFNLDERGTTTRLDCYSPAAFTIEPGGLS